MRQICRIVLIFAGLAFCFSRASQAQSLGDVARQERQKQPAKDSTTRKVVTNDEIPEHIDDSNDDDQDSPSAPASAAATEKSGELWKTRILAQKNQVAALQSQLDRLNSSIHFVQANRYTNGVQYNQIQMQKQQETQRMQQRLDGEKKKLADMQEAARHAGFGNAVYDP